MYDNCLQALLLIYSNWLMVNMIKQLNDACSSSQICNPRADAESEMKYIGQHIVHSTDSLFTKALQSMLETFGRMDVYKKKTFLIQ